LFAAFGAVEASFWKRGSFRIGSQIGIDYWRLIQCSSVPEIIVEGETGFLVEDIDRAVEAVRKIEQISRARCRREFEQRFTDQHMAEDYIRIYQQLRSRSSTQAAA
jgi:hypothetical protein